MSHGQAVSFRLTAPALSDTGCCIPPATPACVVVEAPVHDHTDIRPPPEPPPVVLPPPEPPPGPVKAVTRLTIPQSRTRVSTPTPSMPRRSLLDGVTYNIPLEKGRPHPKAVACFPQGSLSDPGILIRPASSTTRFEFPVPMAFNDPTPFMTDDPSLACHKSSAFAVTKLPCSHHCSGQQRSGRVDLGVYSVYDGWRRQHLRHWSPRTPHGR